MGGGTGIQVGFEQNNVLFNYPEFGDQLIIGKFCSIASDTKLTMGAANPPDQQRDDLTLSCVWRGMDGKHPRLTCPSSPEKGIPLLEMTSGWDVSAPLCLG